MFEGLIKANRNRLRKLGIDLSLIDRNWLKQATRVPTGPVRGSVLLAYVLDPFLLPAHAKVSSAHTHHIESLQMAEVFLDRGYAVDVIHYMNDTFKPRKRYDVFVSARTNFAQIARRVNSDCVKIAHFDTSHYVFNNAAAYERVLDLQRRRGVNSGSIRIIEKNSAIEHADHAVILGNEFTMGTYAYAHKPMYPLNVPTPNVYTSPEQKDFAKARSRFLWLGSTGLVHKGLDLVLEAFAQMPELELYVCGPLDKESEFSRQYQTELRQTKNIHPIGWTDVSSNQFRELANTCSALIYPSCAEGQAGAVVTCTQAGLIPIASYESGMDLHDFGLILNDCSVDNLVETLRRFAARPPEELRTMAMRAWEYARSHHTPEGYKTRYGEIIDAIIKASKRE